MYNVQPFTITSLQYQTMMLGCGYVAPQDTTTERHKEVHVFKPRNRISRHLLTINRGAIIVQDLIVNLNVNKGKQA